MTSAEEPIPPSPARAPLVAGEVPENWYRRAFQGSYLRVYRHRSPHEGVQEAQAAMRLLDLPSEARVLDLGCGAGRHLGPLCGSLRAVGLDRSADLLREARAQWGPGLPVVQGDMRQLPFGSEFDAVLSFFTSFGYFLDDDENERVLEEMGRVLVAGGRLLLDLMDRSSVVAGLVPESEREHDGTRIAERRWISADGRRVEKEVTMDGVGGRDRYHESVRLYTADELTQKLGRAHFEASRFLGSLDGEDYDPGVSRRMIVVAKKASR